MLLGKKEEAKGIRLVLYRRLQTLTHPKILCTISYNFVTIGDNLTVAIQMLSASYLSLTDKGSMFFGVPY